MNLHDFDSLAYAGVLLSTHTIHDIVTHKHYQVVVRTLCVCFFFIFVKVASKHHTQATKIMSETPAARLVVLDMVRCRRISTTDTVLFHIHL